MSTDLRQLSEREREILQLVANGLSNQQIANHLGVSVNTVKVHLRNVFSKIGVASRTEATLYAVRTGIVTIAVDKSEEITELSADSEPSPAHLPGRGSPEDEQNMHPEAQRAELPLARDVQPQVDPVAPQQLADTIPADIGEPLSTVAEPSTPPTRSQGRIHIPRGFILGGIMVLVVLFIAGWWSGFIQREPSTISSNTTGVGESDPGRWKSFTDLTTPRAAFAIATFDDLLYVIGGENQSGVLASVERFDPRFGTWTSLSQKPTPVTDVHAVVVGGKIYVPGGRRSAAMNDIATAVERYDPRSETWESLPDLPEPRSAYALATLEGKIYLIGGWDGTTYRSEVFEYDPDKAAWRQLTSMPSPRAYAQASTIENSVYVIGGENQPNTPMATNEVYTPSQEGENPWSKQAPMPQPRSRFGAAVALSIIHIIGGASGDVDPLKYNARTDSWETFSMAQHPVGSQPGVTLMDSMVFVLGGQTEPTSFSDKMQSYQAVFSVLLPR